MDLKLQPWYKLANELISTQDEWNEFVETYDFVKNKIFQPFGGYSTELPLVALGIHVKAITYKKINIELKEPEENIALLSGPGGIETGGHLLLKWNAGEILKSLGDENPVFEEHDYYDVWSPKFKIRIECGSTTGERLIESFSLEEEFWLIPYPERNNRTFLYKFSKTEKWDKFITRYREFVRERMRWLAQRL